MAERQYRIRPSDGPVGVARVDVYDQRGKWIETLPQHFASTAEAQRAANSHQTAARKRVNLDG